VVLNQGRIEQIGTPQDVYDRPASAFVHDFIGESISLAVHVEGGQLRFDGRALPLDSQGTPAGPARLFVRPYDMSLVAEGEAPLSGTVKHIKAFGPNLRVEIELQRPRDEAIALEVQARRDERIQTGQTVGLKPERYRIFPTPGEAGPAVALNGSAAALQALPSGVHRA
jgi:sulfate transport system ATP-binding protein